MLPIRLIHRKSEYTISEGNRTKLPSKETTIFFYQSDSLTLLQVCGLRETFM